MKKILLSTGFFALSKLMYAGQIFGNFGDDIKQEIEDLWPLIVGVVFVVCCLFNLGNFFGENRDAKKGLANILIYVGAVIAIGYVYKYLQGVSL